MVHRLYLVASVYCSLCTVAFFSLSSPCVSWIFLMTYFLLHEKVVPFLLSHHAAHLLLSLVPRLMLEREIILGCISMRVLLLPSSSPLLWSWEAGWPVGLFLSSSHMVLFKGKGCADWGSDSSGGWHWSLACALWHTESQPIITCTSVKTIQQPELQLGLLLLSHIHVLVSH